MYFAFILLIAVSVGALPEPGLFEFNPESQGEDSRNQDGGGRFSDSDRSRQREENGNERESDNSDRSRQREENGNERESDNSDNSNNSNNSENRRDGQSRPEGQTRPFRRPGQEDSDHKYSEQQALSSLQNQNGLLHLYSLKGFNSSDSSIKKIVERLPVMMFNNSVLNSSNITHAIILPLNPIGALTQNRKNREINKIIPRPTLVVRNGQDLNLRDSRGFELNGESLISSTTSVNETPFPYDLRSERKLDFSPQLPNFAETFNNSIEAPFPPSAYVQSSTEEPRVVTNPSYIKLIYFKPEIQAREQRNKDELENVYENEVNDQDSVAIASNSMQRNSATNISDIDFDYFDDPLQGSYYEENLDGENYGNSETGVEEEDDENINVTDNEITPRGFISNRTDFVSELFDLLTTLPNENYPTFENDDAASSNAVETSAGSSIVRSVVQSLRNITANTNFTDFNTSVIPQLVNKLNFMEQQINRSSMQYHNTLPKLYLPSSTRNSTFFHSMKMDEASGRAYVDNPLDVLTLLQEALSSLSEEGNSDDNDIFSSGFGFDLDSDIDFIEAISDLVDRDYDMETKNNVDQVPNPNYVNDWGSYDDNDIIYNNPYLVTGEIINDTDTTEDVQKGLPSDTSKELTTMLQYIDTTETNLYANKTRNFQNINNKSFYIDPKNEIKTNENNISLKTFNLNNIVNELKTLNSNFDLLKNESNPINIYIFQIYVENLINNNNLTSGQIPGGKNTTQKKINGTIFVDKYGHKYNVEDATSQKVLNHTHSFNYDNITAIEEAIGSIYLQQLVGILGANNAISEFVSKLNNSGDDEHLYKLLIHKIINEHNLTDCNSNINEEIKSQLQNLDSQEDKISGYSNITVIEQSVAQIYLQQLISEYQGFLSQNQEKLSNNPLDIFAQQLLVQKIIQEFNKSESDNLNTTITGNFSTIPSDYPSILSGIITSTPPRLLNESPDTAGLLSRSDLQLTTDSTNLDEGVDYNDYNDIASIENAMNKIYLIQLVHNFQNDLLGSDYSTTDPWEYFINKLYILKLITELNLTNAYSFIDVGNTNAGNSSSLNEVTRNASYNLVETNAVSALPELSTTLESNVNNRESYYTSTEINDVDITDNILENTQSNSEGSLTEFENITLIDKYRNAIDLIKLVPKSKYTQLHKVVYDDYNEDLIKDFLYKLYVQAIILEYNSTNPADRLYRTTGENPLGRTNAQNIGTEATLTPVGASFSLNNSYSPYILENTTYNDAYTTKQLYPRMEKDTQRIITNKTYLKNINNDEEFSSVNLPSAYSKDGSLSSPSNSNLLLNMNSVATERSQVEGLMKYECRSKQDGFYADVQTGCKAFYRCVGDRSYRFVCGPGTLFNQELYTCDHEYKVKCKNY